MPRRQHLPRTPPPRGKYACRVCPFYADDPNAEMKLSPLGITLAPGDRYVFSAFLRREEGATTTSAKVGAGGDKSFYVEGTVPLMSEWGKSTVVYEVAESDPSTTLRLVVLPRKAPNASSPDDCVVIDDAVLLKVK